MAYVHTMPPYFSALKNPRLAVFSQMSGSRDRKLLVCIVTC